MPSTGIATLAPTPDFRLSVVPSPAGVAAPAGPGHRPGSREYRRVMVALFAAGMATFVLIYSTQALLPEFVTAFAVTPSQATLSMSLTTAALAAALLVAGPASEAIGRTRMIHASMWGGTFIALACALAPSWHALLGLRMLLGVSVAGLPAVATAYLREELHPAAHASAAGLYVGGTALGGMAGRLVTAPVADLFGWRWALAAAAAVGLVCAGLVAALLPASRGFVARPAGPSTVARMLRRALSDPGLIALYALGAVSVGTLVAVYNALGFRLTSAPFHLSVGLISLVYLVYPLGAVSSAVSGGLADRIGHRAVIPAGCLTAIAGVSLTGLNLLPTVVIGVAGLTVGFFCIHGLASGWVVARAHATGVSTGQAASLYLFSYYGGSSLFGNLGSAAWSRGQWTGVTELALALLLVACALVGWLRVIPAAAPSPTTRADAQAPGARPDSVESTWRPYTSNSDR